MLFSCVTLFIEDRQFFLSRHFAEANLMFVCQFKLKAVRQGLPAGFNDVF
jgi:hypothetical protein